jgi:chemotaxis family two-component system sensor kinase Cph1
MLLIEPDTGAIRDANSAAVRFYGYPLQSLRSMKIQYINTLTSRQVEAEIARAEVGERSHFVFRHRLASGDVRKVGVWSTPLVFDGETLLLSIVSDLTEMRDAGDPFWHYQSGLEEKVDLQSSQILQYIAQLRAQDRRTIVVLVISVVALLLLSSVLAADVRRRQKAETTAQRLLERNAQANAALHRFAEVAAHHLQEPCRRMASYAGLIKRNLARGVDAEDLEPLAVTLETQALRQRSLVRDMQLYLAAGQATQSSGVEDVAALVREIFVALPARASQAPVTLSVAELAPLPLDHKWLSYCLGCILENAIEHSNPGLPLEIRVFSRSHAGRSQLLIADNGPGIPEEYRERVFGVFEQLSNPTVASHTGIGLAIVRRIMEAVGGTAVAEETPSGGTTVLLEFSDEDLSI